MADSSQTELLFFDTFSHENIEELNLDLVKFPRPAVLHEVHIVPLGTKVQSEVPGGTRLGATNPSSFKLELFVNNLRKPNAATFVKLGILEYKDNKDVMFIAEDLVPTNGLILKGWYTAITIAVFGNVAAIERVSPPPPPPPQQPVHRIKASENHPQADKAPDWEPRQQHPLDYIQQQVEQQMHIQHLQAQQQQQQPSHQQQANPQGPSHSSQHQAQQQQSQQQQSQAPPLPPNPILHQPPHPPPPQAQTPLLPLPHRPSDVYRHKDDLFDTRQSQAQVSASDYASNQREFPGSSRDNFGPREPSLDRSDRSYRRDFGDFSSESKDPFDNPSYFEEQHRSGTTPYERERDVHHREGGGHAVRDGEGPRDYGGSKDNNRELNGKDQRSRSPLRDRDWERDRYKERERPRDHLDREARDRAKSPSSRSRSPSKSRTPPAVSPRQEAEEAEAESTPANEDIYSLTPVHSPNVMFFSDVENQEADDGYEDITSDDEDDGVICGDVTDLLNVECFDVADTWNVSTASFNPFQCDLTPLTHFMDPSLTPYECEKLKLMQAEGNLAMPSEAKTLLDYIEIFSTKEHKKKWVEAMEKVPSLLDKGLSYLLYKENRQDVLKVLIEWCLEGLSLKKGIAQPETAFKVRHLKMGIHLAGSLCSCDAQVAQIAVENNVQHRLLDLYTSKNMSMSLKLQILHALDQTTRLQEGLLWFTATHHSKNPAQRQAEKIDDPDKGKAISGSDHCYPNNEVSAEEKMEVDEPDDEKDKSDEQKEYSCYQRLVKIMMKREIVRVAVAGTALLRKIHTFEVLCNFYSTVEQMLDNMTCLEDNDVKMGSEDSMNGGTNDENEVDPIVTNVINLSDINTDLLITYLDEITKVMTRAPFLIAQPRRSLPSSLMFEIRQHPHDIYPNLYAMCYSCQLLECLFVLLSSPATVNHLGLFVAIRDFFQQLLNSQSGLLFLCARPDTTNGILRVLIQMGDYNREDNNEENPLQLLGLQLIYHLQTLQYVDQLSEYHRKASLDKDIDDAEPLGLLHSMYLMTVNTLGRESVVNVLGLDQNLKVLLPFVEPTGDDAKDARLKKSVCAGYVSELVLMLIRQSENMEMLQRFASQLLTISEDGKSSVTLANPDQSPSKLVELQEWLAPTKKVPTFSYESLQPLILQLKVYADDILKFPRGLITVMRVLNWLAVPPDCKYTHEKPIELKYKYVIIELLSADCFPLFTSFLQKLTEWLQRPWQQGIPQSNSQFFLVLAILKPALSIINTTLAVLIMSRGAEFRDLTALPILFELHAVLCSVPSAIPYLNDIQLIQRSILDTLLSFTQPILMENEEGLSQSLWTLMMKELLKHTLTSPYRYLSGLLLFSELLPLPLPIQTKEPLSTEENTLVITSRKLWSAHLHPVTPQIHQVIHLLAFSSCLPLQQALRRVCWQIADLAAPSACMVTKCLLEMLEENLVSTFGGKEKISEEKKEGEKEIPDEEETEKSSSPQSLKLLNLFGHFVSQPSMKAAILCQLRSSLKSEDRTQDLLTLILKLLNVSSEKSTQRIQEQEQIMTIIQNLCDPEITLVPAESSLTFMEQLSAAIPMSEHLKQIIAGILKHIGIIENSFTSILPCIRTLALLCEHDLGFFHVKNGLKQEKQVFYKLLSHLNSTYNKDNAECLQVLSSTIEFLRLLLTQSTDDDGSFGRTYTLSIHDLRTIVCWGVREEHHPLYDLEKVLEDCAKDNETLDSLLESSSALIQALEDKTTENTENKDLLEVSLPESESLSCLFNQRAAFVLTEADDERLSSAFWLSVANFDDNEIELDIVRCDLQDLVSKYCPEFNLEEELKKGTVTTSYDGPPKPKRDRLGRRKSSEGVHFPRGKGRASVRGGRGTSRGMASNRSDPFRSRPPNTSRPPSMHVDDFNKLQKTSQQLMGATGISRRPEKFPLIFQEMGRGRGRGFDRNQSFSRGRFFTPPGNYSRRNAGQFSHNTNKPVLSYYPQNTRGGGNTGGGGGGGGSGGGGGGSNSGGGGGGVNLYGNRTSLSFNNPRQFIRGGLDKRTTVDRRTGRDGRFTLRGGRGGAGAGGGVLPGTTGAVGGGGAGVGGGAGGAAGANAAGGASSGNNNHWFAAKAKEPDMRLKEHSFLRILARFQPTFRGGRRDTNRHFRSFTK